MGQASRAVCPEMLRSGDETNGCVMSNQSPEPATEYLLIGGRPVDGPVKLAVHNPACPAQLVGTIVCATAAQIGDAVAAAKQAQPAWAAMSFWQRAELLEVALARLEHPPEERAALFVRENGRILDEARRELTAVAPRQRLMLRHADLLDSGRDYDAPRGETHVRWRPYGVVASIVPWNAPVSLAFTQMVSALFAGNCAVLKPPETCPLTLIRTARDFAAALPPGTLNIVTGHPAEIGPVLTSHPDIAKIAFTGGIVSARRILASAAQTITPVTLELGGNDPAIILEDAEFSPATMDAMVSACFQMSGQVCMAIKRIFVPARRQAEFLRAFIAAGEKLLVGDGLKPGITMGPLHNDAARERIRGFLADAAARGGQIHPLGRLDDAVEASGGYFVQPAIVSGLTDDAPLMAEEQFGPVIPLTAYETIDEAVRRANDSVYGLSGSVWGQDVQEALAVGRRLEAGQVWINAHGARAVNHLAPYGGVKQSGAGRKSGLEGVLEYLQSQTITACYNRT